MNNKILKILLLALTDLNERVNDLEGKFNKDDEDDNWQLWIDIKRALKTLDDSFGGLDE